MTSLILSMFLIGGPPPKAPPVREEVPPRAPQVTEPVLYTQVCENGICRLVPISGSGVQAAPAYCPTGTCPPASGYQGWYPGRLFGRRR